MAHQSYIIWLAEADEPQLCQAYPQARLLRADRHEPGIVVYQVEAAVLPSATTFPLVDGARWNGVFGGYAVPGQAGGSIAALPVHAWSLAVAPPPNDAAPPGAKRWKQDQWYVDSDLSIGKMQHDGWEETDDLFQIWIFNRKARAETKLDREMERQREE